MCFHRRSVVMCQCVITIRTAISAVVDVYVRTVNMPKPRERDRRGNTNIPWAQTLNGDVEIDLDDHMSLDQTTDSSIVRQPVVSTIDIIIVTIMRPSM